MFCMIVRRAFDTHELVSTFRASFALLKYKHVWLIWTQIKSHWSHLTQRSSCLEKGEENAKFKQTK